MPNFIDEPTTGLDPQTRLLIWDIIEIKKEIIMTEEEIKTLGREYNKIRDGYQLKAKNTAEATRLIVEHQEIFRDYEVVKGRMDDVFLAVTGKTLGGEHK